MNMLILYMVQKTHTGPYYRVQALFMYGVGLRTLVQLYGLRCVRMLT